jgi:hypothetical protein
MKRGDAFPSRWLSKDDVTSPVVATIDDVRMETIPGDRADEERAVMHFAGGILKALILNATNWTACEDAYGGDTDDWRGKPVELYIDPGVMYAGKRVGGVRLRAPKKESQADGSWTLAQAVAECASVGIDRAALVASLKEQGKAAYNPARDTSAVKALIAKVVRANENDGDEIPF